MFIGPKEYWDFETQSWREKSSPQKTMGKSKCSRVRVRGSGGREKDPRHKENVCEVQQGEDTVCFRN